MEQSRQKTDYAGTRILITAGPTVEDIDPVRFISNRSSGKMGVALAVAAAERGARVTLVHGPLQVAVPSLSNITPVPVRSAEDMYDAVMQHIDGVDVAIMCAAVADYAPTARSTEKIKKESGETLRLELKRTRDILAALGAMESKPFLVGFAAETEDIARHAQQKLEKKNCDMLCANDVSKPGSGFGSDSNQITIHKRGGEAIQLPSQSKKVAAAAILDEIARTR